MAESSRISSSELRISKAESDDNSLPHFVAHFTCCATVKLSYGRYRDCRVLVQAAAGVGRCLELLGNTSRGEKCDDTMAEVAHQWKCFLQSGVAEEEQGKEWKITVPSGHQSVQVPRLRRSRCTLKAVTSYRTIQASLTLHSSRSRRLRQHRWTRCKDGRWKLPIELSRMVGSQAETSSI